MGTDPACIEVTDAVDRRRRSAQQFARLVEPLGAAREQEAAQAISRIHEPLMSTEDRRTKVAHVD